MTSKFLQQVRNLVENDVHHLREFANRTYIWHTILTQYIDSNSDWFNEDFLSELNAIILNFHGISKSFEKGNKLVEDNADSSSSSDEDFDSEDAKENECILSIPMSFHNKYNFKVSYDSIKRRYSSSLDEEPKEGQESVVVEDSPSRPSSDHRVIAHDVVRTRFKLFQKHSIDLVAMEACLIFICDYVFQFQYRQGINELFGIFLFLTHNVIDFGALSTTEEMSVYETCINYKYAFTIRLFVGFFIRHSADFFIDDSFSFLQRECAQLSLLVQFFCPSIASHFRGEVSSVKIQSNPIANKNILFENDNEDEVFRKMQNASKKNNKSSAKKLHVDKLIRNVSKVKRKVRKSSNKFNEEEDDLLSTIEAELYAVPWLLTLFSNKIKDIHLVLSFWDLFLLYDCQHHYLYVALSLLIFYGKRILNTEHTSLPEILCLLRFTKFSTMRRIWKMSISLNNAFGSFIFLRKTNHSLLALSNVANIFIHDKRLESKSLKINNDEKKKRPNALTKLGKQDFNEVLLDDDYSAGGGTSSSSPEPLSPVSMPHYDQYEMPSYFHLFFICHSKKEKGCCNSIRGDNIHKIFFHYHTQNIRSHSPSDSLSNIDKMNQNETNLCSSICEDILRKVYTPSGKGNQITFTSFLHEANVSREKVTKKMSFINPNNLLTISVDSPTSTGESHPPLSPILKGKINQFSNQRRMKKFQSNLLKTESTNIQSNIAESLIIGPPVICIVNTSPYSPAVVKMLQSSMKIPLVVLIDLMQVRHQVSRHPQSLYDLNNIEKNRIYLFKNDKYYTDKCIALYKKTKTKQQQVENGSGNFSEGVDGGPIQTVAPSVTIDSESIEYFEVFIGYSDQTFGFVLGKEVVLGKNKRIIEDSIISFDIIYLIPIEHIEKITGKVVKDDFGEILKKTSNVVKFYLSRSLSTYSISLNTPSVGKRRNSIHTLHHSSEPMIEVEFIIESKLNRFMQIVHESNT